MGNEKSPTENSPTFDEVLENYISRRKVLQGGLSAAAAALLFSPFSARANGSASVKCKNLLSFTGIEMHRNDVLTLAPGYEAEVLFAWGDPVSDGPAFKPDASNTAEEAEQQAGMHHDGIAFYPLPYGSGNPNHGLLAINHEYIDNGLLFPDGTAGWNAQKVRKSQASSGVSIIEVRRRGHKWEVVRPSPYGRRIHANTPMVASGPAAGHPKMQTAADPTGRLILGNFSNCAGGFTPWGTYLTTEENAQQNFGKPSNVFTAEERRFGFTRTGNNYQWYEADPRFNLDINPNEGNRFGWVVEIDPYRPGSPPVKRTAMGRFHREGNALAELPDGRLAYYMCDDDRFEYIFKFVTRDAYNPHDREANRDLLDHGTLYVARYEADGTGRWIELTYGKNGLDASTGFPDQACVLINARGAADVVGGTKLDRPEWAAVHPDTGEVYAALTNNPNRVATDAANPRPANVYGHILRWRENGEADATTFEWDIFVLAGDPAQSNPAKQGNIKGDIFGSPDGLAFDRRGVLWIGTDVSASALLTPDYANIGNNQLLAADPNTGEIRRFMVGPINAEITGVFFTPDSSTMFVSIQHPGENPAGNGANDPANPTRFSSWPDGGRPRSATLAVRKIGGGPIGT